MLRGDAEVAVIIQGGSRGRIEKYRAQNHREHSHLKCRWGYRKWEQEREAASRKEGRESQDRQGVRDPKAGEI